MRTRRVVPLLLLTTAPIAQTPAPVKLSENDVWFNWRLATAGTRYQETMCGFKIEGNHLSTQIVGPPSAVKAVRTIVATEPAERLFSAFYNAAPITIWISYQDGSTDTLLVENWHDHMKFASDKNAYMHQCEEGMQKAIAAPSHPGSRL